MVFSETLKAVPDQFLDILGMTQEMILTNASAFVETARSFAPPVQDIPFADRLPDPVIISDSIFGMADKVLTSQKDFSHRLMELYSPAVPAAAPAPAKAATAKS